jgi:hypothetical protein
MLIHTDLTYLKAMAADLPALDGEEQCGYAKMVVLQMAWQAFAAATCVTVRVSNPAPGSAGGAAAGAWMLSVSMSLQVMSAETCQGEKARCCSVGSRD